MQTVKSTRIRRLYAALPSAQESDEGRIFLELRVMVFEMLLYSDLEIIFGALIIEVEGLGDLLEL